MYEPKFRGKRKRVEQLGKRTKVVKTKEKVRYNVKRKQIVQSELFWENDIVTILFYCGVHVPLHLASREYHDLIRYWPILPYR